MLLQRISEPDLPISAREILSHVREGSTAEVSLVESYIFEAMDCIETVCERAIGFARYALTINTVPTGTDNLLGPLPFTQHRVGFDAGDFHSPYYTSQKFSNAWPSAVTLNMPVVQKIESVAYYDSNNDPQVWDAAKYQFQQAEPGVLFPVSDESWPTVYPRRDAVTITFWSGETDQLQFTEGGDPAFSSLSGYPWADGDALTLRASGNVNAFLGNVASVPAGFTNNRKYYVVGSDDAGSFNLALTSGGAPIEGTTPDVPSEIDLLLAGRMKGTTAAGLRKIVTDSYRMRCSEGSCSCSGQGADAFVYEPHLRKMLWRPAMETML